MRWRAEQDRRSVSGDASRYNRQSHFSDRVDLSVTVVWDGAPEFDVGTLA
jgi:hypothetical protein